MGLGSYYVTSTKMCFSTEDFNEWMIEHYNNNDDDEKIFPIWFYLLYCGECGTYREFKNNIHSHHRSHRLLFTCNYCQNNFKTFKSRQVRCLSCRRLIASKLKTYTSEKIKKIATVYNIKGRRTDYMTDDLVQKVENYIP